jgi:16S rRNA processing protein RimM
MRIVQAKEHGDAIVAQAQEIPDRTAAEALHGVRIFVSRSSFPTADADEYYWVDLIGLAVSNIQGEALGTVVGLLDTGAHSVLRVVPDALPEGKSAQEAERLIPFVAAYVDSVSLPERRIVVDWGLDF